MPNKLVLVAGILALFIVWMNFQFAPGNIISWDVYGYYLYLPTTFIYHDLGMLNDHVILDLMNQYESSATFYQAMKMPEGHYVMKYSLGMAILYAPFFFIGWLYARLFDFPIDGFSVPFQYALFIGSTIYSLIGVWFLAKVLNRFFEWKVSALVLVLIVFATNYMVHVTMYGQNAMSQNYLFTAYALILWFTIKWHDDYMWRYAIGLGLVLSLTVLSRPTEIVALSIPVLWGVYNKETLLNKIQVLLRHKTQVIALAVLMIGIGSLQLVYWKFYTGKFLFNSYGGNAGEGLELLSPFTKQFLFSFRKGWLIYTPIMIIAISGFWYVYKRNRAIFFSLIIYFILNLYLVSSWSNWWYAQSFSQRAMVSSYPIMAITLGYFLVWLFGQKRVVRSAGFTVIIVLLGLNVFQTIQFDKGIIHADRMTKDYYFASFGKLSVSEEDQALLLIDRSFTGADAFMNEEAYNGKLLKFLEFENGESEIAYSGCCAIVLDSTHIYSPVIESEYQKVTNKNHAWIKVSAYVYPSEDDIENAFSLTVNFNHNGYSYGYRGLESKDVDLIPNQWNRLEMDYLTPEVRNKSDLLQVKLWYRGNKSLLVDDLKVEVFEKKIRF